MEGRSSRQRPQVFWQQSTISRTDRMEGVRGLAVTQVDGGQRRQIVGVDKVADCTSEATRWLRSICPKASLDSLARKPSVRRGGPGQRQY